ncbi:MAG: NAD(P)/FAD-dependent oxidoreductase [Bacteroidia bacterium]
MSLSIYKEVMQSLAIIGTGIAGMGCAHLLQHKYNISLFEQNDYIGGHTNTITINENGKDVYLDTGFMVFNFKTYPNLCKLFEEIKAPIKKTDMSFSVQYKPTALEYCGSGINGLFAQRKNIFNTNYIKMLMQITRFNKESVKIMNDSAYSHYTIGQYIKEKGFGEDMLWKYLVPMSSAVWSTPMELMLDFPAQTLIRFFYNHGFLGLNTQHQWYTLEDGSQSYRELLIKPFKDKIFTNRKVKKVKRTGNKASLFFEGGSFKEFDKVIFASHGDETLNMLQEPTADEKRLLSNFKYQSNKAIVHTDESIMPKTKATWSSWNYCIELVNGKQVPTTIYWMNRLQGVSKNKNYFVSINAIEGSIDKNKIIKEIDYHHPLFDLPAIRAQDELYKLNETGPLYYCGSYFKYGFHEDAYKSAVDLCKTL